MFEVSQQRGAAQLEIESRRRRHLSLSTLYSSLFSLSISASKESGVFAPRLLRNNEVPAESGSSTAEQRLKSEEA